MKNSLNNITRWFTKVRPGASRMLCLVVFGLLAAQSATVRGANDDLLSSERWESRGEGLSLRPPLGSQTLQLSGDDAILRIGHPDGYKITLYVKQSKRDLTLDEVVRSAVEQASRTPTTVRKIQDPFNVKLGDLDAKGFSFAAPDVTPPTVIVQIFAMITPRKVLIVEMNSDPKLYENARPAFDQMLASVQFDDPKTLLEERKKDLDAGQKWLSALTPEVIHKSLIARQWFRMMDGKTDIGYMRIDQRKEHAMNRNGVRIDVQSRLVIGDQAYDTLSNYFTSDDTDPKTRTEVWSVRTTARPRSSVKGSTAPREDASWAETGLLSKGVLSLTRESPQEKKPYEWADLPSGYITQVYAQLLPTLLTPADKETMAFYAYYGNTGKITLRTERVEVAADGSYKVFSRPSPEQKEQITWFDAKGNFVRRDLPGGQVLLPATAEQIITRWQIKQ